jgi:hypothetical protein
MADPLQNAAVRDFPAHRVFLARSWADPWQEVLGLYCNRALWGSGQALSAAELEWHYGDGILPGESTFGQKDPLCILDWYVKIEIDVNSPGTDPLCWYGFVTESRRVLDRRPAQPAGRQVLSCTGFELLLARTFVRTSFVQGSSGDIKIRRGLCFNGEGARVEENGNCAQQPGARGAAIFSGDTDPAHCQTWSTRAIVEYLLAYHPPADVAGNVWLQWQLSDRAKTCLPDWDSPKIQSDGRDLRSILNQLLDRRRGLSWRLDPYEDGAGHCVVELDVFTFNDEMLVLPGGLILQANDDQTTLELDAALGVDLQVLESAEHQVQQVLVRGARKRSVFSVSYPDGTLAADWQSADESAYEGGGPGAGETDISKREERVRDFRRGDHLRRVFSWFRLVENWDGKACDGQGVGGGPTPVFPAEQNADGQVETFYLPGLRFDHRVPAGLAVSGPNVSVDEEMPILALMRLDQPTSHYQHVEALAAAAEVEGCGDGGGQCWSASVQAQPDAPGIIVRVHGGVGIAQHSIGGPAFTPLPQIDDPAEADWKDNLIVTAMVELDGHVEAVYPPDDEVQQAGEAGLFSEVNRQVVIDLHDKARLDWIHEKAVLGHEDGVLQYPPTGAYAWRDDRPEMLTLAQCAYEFYGKPRTALSLTFTGVVPLLRVGQLITTLGSDQDAEEVQSVVTAMSIDLVSGRTQYTTAFAELDFAELW